MVVDSYLELYTTLFGWLFYGIIWNVLAETGLLLIPFILMIANTIIEGKRKAKSDELMQSSMRSFEVDFVVAFFIITLCGVPYFPLQASEVSFTPKAIAGVSQPTVTANTSTSTFGSISFSSFPSSIEVPAAWYGVLKFTGGLNRAIIQGVPALNDLRAYFQELNATSITDPVLRAETQDFVRDCFAPARASWDRMNPKPMTIAPFNTLFAAHGFDDVDWIGSRVFRSVPGHGFYDSRRSSKIREGFLFDPNRDYDLMDQNGLGISTYGKPYCDEWYLNSSHGLRQKITSYAGRLRNFVAWYETLGTVTDTDDRVVRILMEKGAEYFRPRGYDYAYETDKQGLGGETGYYFEQLNNLNGLAAESFKLDQYLNLIIRAEYMIQAILLFCLYMLLPIFILANGYKISTLTTGCTLIFTIKFWSVLWFAAFWLDNNLIVAMYPDAREYSLNYISTEGANPISRMILNILTSSLHIFLPLFFTGILSYAGFRGGAVLANMASATNGKMTGVPSKGAKIIGKMAPKAKLGKG